MKALLINPPTGYIVREDRCQADVSKMLTGAMRIPLDLMYMASVLESIGVECRIKDYPVLKANWDTLKEDLREFKPNYLVMSITTSTLKSDLTACDIAKEIDLKIITIAKGAHFLTHDKEAFEFNSNIDIVIRGETESTIKDIVKNHGDLKDVKGITYRKAVKILKNEDRGLEQDLDSLPFPARHLIDNNLYMRPDIAQPQTTISTSRGCPYKCIYCLAPAVSGAKLRTRSPKNVVDEVEQCVNKYNIHNFIFLADTFTYDEKWVVNVCKEITDRKLVIKWACNSRVNTINDERLKWMKKAGCWLIAFGTENGNQDLLNKMKKGITLDQSKEAIRLCRKYGIKTYTYFIFGLPWETKETAKKTSQFARELDGDYAEFYVAYPFPGTEYYDMGLEMELFKHDDLSKAKFAGHDKPFVKTPTLSADDLIKIKKSAEMKFYLRPKYIFRTLKGIRSVSEVKNHILAGIRMFTKISG